MQPTAHEIEQEKEALRDIRRRSVAQVGTLDPDLPSPSAIPPSPNGFDADDDLMLGGDPSHLFWVPASVHPEIAPSEFREFLKDHAQLARSKSQSSTSTGGVGRRKSMLSKQYRPGDSDATDSETEGKLKPRRRSTFRGGEMMTLEQLQNLEEAASSGDPAQLRSVLRRSMSLGAPLTEEPDDGSSEGDHGTQSTPLTHRPSGPGQIVRRAARTKVRKPGNGSLSFQAHRRGSATHIPETPPMPIPDHVRQSKENERPPSFSEESSIYDSYSYDYDTPATSVENATTDAQPAISYYSPQTVPSRAPEPAFAVIKQQHPVLQHPQPQHVTSQPQLHIPPPPPIHRTPSPPQSGHFSETLQSQPLQGSKSPAPIAPSLSPQSQGKKDKEKKSSLFGFGGSKKDKERENLKEKKEREKERDKEKEEKDSFLSSLFSSKKKVQNNFQVPTQTAGPRSPSHSENQSAVHALLGPPTTAASRTPSPTPVMNYARYPIHVERAVYRLSHIKLANPRRALLEQVLISNLMFWYLGVINRAGQNQPAQTNNGTNIQPQSQQATQQPQSQSIEVDNEDPIQQFSVPAQNTEPSNTPVFSQPIQQQSPAERERDRAQTRRGSLTRPDNRPDASRKAETPVRSVNYEAQARSLTLEGQYSGDFSRNGSDGFGGQRPTPNYHLPQRMQQPSSNAGVQNNVSEDYESLFYYQPPPQTTPTNADEWRTHGPVAPNGLPPGAMMPLDHTPIPNQPIMNYNQTPWSSPAGGIFGPNPDLNLSFGQTNSGLDGPHSAPPHHQSHNRYQTPQAQPTWTAGPQSLPRHPPSSGSHQQRDTSPPQSPPRSNSPARSRSPPPFRAPSSGVGNKLPGRSLSANAVPANAPGRLKKKNSASAYTAANLEDEDVPLAVWQERQRKR